MEAASCCDEAPLDVLRLGRRPYCEVWELQKKLQRALIDGHGRDTLILCEHDPVITIGRSGSAQNLLVPQDELARKGIEFFEIERGGDITYHGPGQLVGYPIIRLTRLKQDVGWYMRELEAVLLSPLEALGVHAERVTGKTGLWIQPDSTEPRLCKIASMGIRISRWCTMHGFSLNVLPCHDGFALINPCGFADIGTTSVEEQTGARHTVEDIAHQILYSFCQRFGFSPNLGRPPSSM